jgi:NAD-specific glutamate dehydrogenase
MFLPVDVEDMHDYQAWLRGELLTRDEQEAISLQEWEYAQDEAIRRANEILQEIANESVCS